VGDIIHALLPFAELRLARHGCRFFGIPRSKEQPAVFLIVVITTKFTNPSLADINEPRIKKFCTVQDSETGSCCLENIPAYNQTYPPTACARRDFVDSLRVKAWTPAATLAVPNGNVFCRATCLCRCGSQCWTCCQRSQPNEGQSLC
jgi:hypothetical protein